MKSNKHNLRFAFMLATFSGLGPFTFDMYLPSFPQMVKFFGTTASTIQISLTACLLGLALGQITMGALSDVHGRRKPLIIAMIIYCLSSLGCAIAPNIGIFIALRFIQGFAVSAGTISSAIARDTHSGTELTKFFSLISVMSSVAPLLAPLAGSAVISFTKWQGVFYLLGMLGFILSITTIWRLKESLPVEKRIRSNVGDMFGNFKTLLGNRVYMGYVLAQGFMLGGVFAYVAGTPFVYQKIYGVSPQVFAMLFALNGIVLITASQIVRKLAGRIPEHRILHFGLGLSFVATITVLVVVLTHGPLFALVIPLVCYVAAMGTIGPVSFTLAMESQGHIAGSASALLGVIPFLLGCVSSPLVGIAGEYSAVPLSLILLSASLLSIASYTFLTFMRRVKVQSTEMV
ncbi:multidrug effflux MFS transporter [Alicyclobacillus acidoterrestris]|uniref:Bcr/CflA family efflux transporter n=1 Tax=Alicyclobacillus acidoterrestris (strain ATCC 49025 / DSM 3922 / CIP 106132 / NCIMB 13137 / GD3B) TaxID=1356854 RepID=T0CS80_ALIAG|nr:multidrug effflux MFS transporter [Alicyclobacillus acidoterrestris]EPZ42307.1 MFS transporter [Alicyclobacillus acidoterrestris ATCC 49025]UNO48138.1 multidrug effflux MFS transporter [Alicyclobacillus acidoterrestris]